MHSEFARKALHAVVGIVLAITIAVARPVGIIIASLLLLIGIVASFQERSRRIPFVSWLLDRMERPTDRATLPGKGFLCMLVGVIATSLLFSSKVAAAAIIILAIGDSVSHLAGRSLYTLRTRIHHKAWEGAIIGAIASFIVLMPFISGIAAALASIIALAVEYRLGPHHALLFNDNIIVPLIAGTVLHVYGLLGGLL